MIVKTQVWAGGRGKGYLTSGLRGGVKICSTPEEVKKLASQMIGFRLITQQTTAEGETVHKVLVLEGVNIVRELYLAIVLDAAAGGPVIIVSPMVSSRLRSLSSVVNYSSLLNAPPVCTVSVTSSQWCEEYLFFPFLREALILKMLQERILRLLLRYGGCIQDLLAIICFLSFPDPDRKPSLHFQEGVPTNRGGSRSYRGRSIISFECRRSD